MTINRRHFLFLLTSGAGAFALNACALAEKSNDSLEKFI